MRIFSIILSIILFVLIVILGFGYGSNPNFETTKEALYDDKIENVWKALTTIESYPNNKNKLQEVEIIDRKFNRITSWREIYENGNIREYNLIEKNNSFLYVLEMNEPQKNRTGIWEYYLEKDSNRTKITITEKSSINNVFWRGIMKILGRDNYINSEFKWIRVALFNKLLD